MNVPSALGWHGPRGPDRVLPRQACDREMMCEADVAETV